MSYTTWTKANDLKERASTLLLRQKLPALVRRLIHATIDKPRLAQFPADEGVQRRGWDGVLETDNYNAWVPIGQSVWEMGTNEDFEAKAEEDYKKRTSNPGSVDPKKTAFVFVTPRKWEGKANWRKEKLAEGKWRDVVVHDCDDLEQWLETAPAVDIWLARLLEKAPVGIRDANSYWESLSATSDPPLTSMMFLAGRAKAVEGLKDALAGAASEVAIHATSLRELRDFVTAVLASGDDEVVDQENARAVIVETWEAWGQLSTTKNPLFLLPGDQIAVDKSMVAEAVRAGHHVLTQLSYTYLQDSVAPRLPRAERYDLEKALEAGGFADDRAKRLARECGGCLSVLVRLASRFTGQVSPLWSKAENADALLPLVLLGAWSDRNEDDRKAVTRLTARPYGESQKLVMRWMNETDSPLQFVEGVYSFVSREESWALLNPYFNEDILNAFTDLALEILGEDDPRFEMKANERILAGIYKKLPRFSSDLREGVAETVALLGARGESTPPGSPHGSSWRAARIVTKLLSDASEQRWFSLAPALPLLAEASPDEFLCVLEKELEKSNRMASALFQKDADGFNSWSGHTHLMWGLELLAWDSEHLARVVMILAALIKIDPGGNINPRPEGVLFDIFRFWFPQTGASIEERLQVLDYLAERESDVAWKLLLGLLPYGHDTAIESYKPRWRGYATGATEGITDADIVQQADWAANRIVKIAEQNPQKWQMLLGELAKLPEIAARAVINWLRGVNVVDLCDKVRIELWEKVRNLIIEHRFFHDAWWVLPGEVLNELAEIEIKLRPKDPLVRWRWLFGNGTFNAFGTSDSSFEERERLENIAQSEAIHDIYNERGLAGVVDLALSSTSASKIGSLVANLSIVSDWRDLLPEMLIASEPNKRDLALGYASAIHRGDPTWTERLPLEEWSTDKVAQIALVLNCEPATWEMLRRRKPDAEHEYWRRVYVPGSRLSGSELEEAVAALLQSKRPLAAVQALLGAIHNKKHPSVELSADAVDLASTSPEFRFNQHTLWETLRLLEHLQKRPEMDRDRLMELEMRFIHVARYHQFTPKTLHAELEQKPAFFAEIIAAKYRSKDEPRRDDEPPDVTKRAVAEAAGNFLESWVTCPGGNPITSKSLADWIAKAREICTENGRLAVCDLHIGEQLSYATPTDENDWPCEPVRNVLEAFRSDGILRGFQQGVMNQRGVTSRSMTEGGQQERALAVKYRSHGEKWKTRWPRTALALRRIAEHYESQAKWYDEQVDGRK